MGLSMSGILHFTNLFNRSLKINHQAQIPFARAKESCCSKFYRAVTECNPEFHENLKAQCKATGFFSQDPSLSLPGSLAQIGVVQPIHGKACKMPRF